MQLGTYMDGHALGYEEATGQFDIGGAPVSAQDVVAWDNAGQITWLREDLRTWTHAVASPAPAAPSVMPTPKPAGWAGLPTYAKVLIILGIISIVGCCGTTIVLGIIGAATESSSSSGGTGGGTAATQPVEAVPPAEPITPSATLSESEYAQAVTEITNDVAGALTELGSTLSSNPQGVLADEDVQADLQVQMDIISGGYDRVRELVPPDRFVSMHEDLVEAMRLFDQSMQQLGDGIDHTDVESINKAAELMTQGSEKMQSATQKLAAGGD